MIGTTMLLKSQQVSIFLVVSCSRENRFLHMVAPSLSPESVKLILCNFRKTALRTRLSVFLAILSLHQLGERSMIGHNRLLSHNDLTFFFPSDLSFTDSGRNKYRHHRAADFARSARQCAVAHHFKAFTDVVERYMRLVVVDFTEAGT